MFTLFCFAFSNSSSGMLWFPVITISFALFCIAYSTTLYLSPTSTIVLLSTLTFSMNVVFLNAAIVNVPSIFSLNFSTSSASSDSIMFLYDVFSFFESSEIIYFAICFIAISPFTFLFSSIGILFIPCSCM